MPRMQMNLVLIIGDTIYETRLDADAESLLASKGALRIESALAAPIRQLSHKLAERVARGRGINTGNVNIYGLGSK